MIDKLNDELSRTYNKLNEEILCKVCYNEKEVKKLKDKCGNKGIVYYERHSNPEHYRKRIQWIPFNKFSNIEYLAKGCFGEVYKKYRKEVV